MSYDIYLNEPGTDETIEFDCTHEFEGGTHALGGTNEAWLNVTWNYGDHFRRVMGEKGIRSIYGLTGEESIPILEAACAGLGDDVDPNYWTGTEGNAKAALMGLLAFARARPDGVWAGD